CQQNADEAQEKTKSSEREAQSSQAGNQREWEGDDAKDNGAKAETGGHSSRGRLDWPLRPPMPLTFRFSVCYSDRQWQGGRRSRWRRRRRDGGIGALRPKAKCLLATGTNHTAAGFQAGRGDVRRAVGAPNAQHGSSSFHFVVFLGHATLLTSSP